MRTLVRKALPGWVVLVLMSLPSKAQTTVSALPQPSFEVAIVRQTAPGATKVGQWSAPGTGKFWASGLSLEYLIGMAYGVDANQIAGKPGWLSSELYDVTAKPEAGVALSREELKPLLQDLLRQRFHLAIHRETRMMPGYALVVAKGGPKLQPTKGDHFPGFRANVSAGQMNGFNWSMPFLAGMLQRPAGLPVVDRTGLPGSFDITLEYAPDVAVDSTLPSLFTALQETLGLKLETRKVPVVMLLIDHVDRIPAAN